MKKIYVAGQVSKVLLAIALVLPGLAFAQKKAKQQPNIIFVLADDLGYGDLKATNPDSKMATPYLDNLAKEGMVFTDTHSSSAVCTPTRYGILTGRYNWRSTLKSNVLTGESDALIDPSRLTVAGLLKQAGYQTAFMGKWHLGWNWAKDANGHIDFSKPISKGPQQNGFDYSYGFCGSLDMGPYVYVENGKATAIPVDSTENTDYYGFWRKGLTAPDFVHEQVLPNVVDRACRYISESATSGKPFFLYLPLPSPHTPILPTSPWLGKSNLNIYGDYVMMTDYYVGQLEKAVKAAGIEGNTLIVFTSDNGCSPRANYEQLATKGHNPSYIWRGTKADIFEGGHRIPLIMKWPGHINAGTTSQQTTCLVDFFATCADITGQQLADNQGEDSYSMVALFKNPQSANYLRKSTIHHSINGSFAIRQGNWKLILCPDSGGWGDPTPEKAKKMSLPPIQLYNLATDPGEKNNLYSTYPDVVNELKHEIEKQIKQGRSTPGAQQSNEGGNWWPELRWMNAGGK